MRHLSPILLILSLGHYRALKIFAVVKCHPNGANRHIPSFQLFSIMGEGRKEKTSREKDVTIE